jgi:hypothetical protein
VAGSRAGCRGPNARHIVTDTNRKAGARGSTSCSRPPAPPKPPTARPTRASRTDVDASDFTLSDDARKPIVQLAGAKSIDGVRVRQRREPVPRGSGPTTRSTATRARRGASTLPKFRALPGAKRPVLRIDLGRRVRADHVDGRTTAQPAGHAAITSFDVVLDGTRVFPVTVDPAQAFTSDGTSVPLDGKPFSTLEVRIPTLATQVRSGSPRSTIPGVEVEEVVRLPAQPRRARPRQTGPSRSRTC